MPLMAGLLRLLLATLALALSATANGMVPMCAVAGRTIVVFGGTGHLGRECVYQSLKAKYSVVVLAKDPSKMLIPTGSGGADADKPLIDPRLKVLTGDVTDQASVDATFAAAGNDVAGVVVALGGKTKLVGKTMLTDGTRCIISGMKRLCGSKRIAVVTSIGAGDSEKGAPFKFKALMYTVLKSVFADKNNQERLFLEPGGPGHDLEYCIVRPGGLGKGAPTGVVKVIEGQAGSIHRSDLASFLLRAVTDKAFPHLRKTPCVSSVGGTGWVKDASQGFDGVNSED